MRPKSSAPSIRPMQSSMEFSARPLSSRPTMPTSHSAPVLHTNHHTETWNSKSTSSKYLRSVWSVAVFYSSLLNEELTIPISSTYRPKKPSKKPGVAGHTRTSILRTLSASNAMDWSLPESKSMLNRQFSRGRLDLRISHCQRC